MTKRRALRVTDALLKTWADGQAVSHTVAEGFGVLSVSATAGSPADWAVTW